ncbi:MAG: hypothetical protein IKO99_03170 [Bacteroidales bacterium]|nr:hypothetical protein [Bacteroidales bacterium]MBR4676984.1 hypothetical protein [Bacteroidales bacterium]
MNTSAFVGIMLLIVFAFIAGMIWAYRKNDYKTTKREFKTEVLNSLDSTLETITVHTGGAAALGQNQPDTDGSQEEKDKTSEIELESRKQIIQEKNHIKKSAADEYFERTKKMANEILQPKK